MNTFKLSPKEIAYLAQSFSDASSISLYANIKKTPDGSEYQNLISKGIIKGNNFDPEALSLLQLLAKPERCARLLIQTPFCVIEKYVYATSGKLILADNADGEFMISELTDMSALIIYLSEFFGLSKIKTVGIDVALTPAEMLVLLAMTDLYRRKSLAAYIAGSSETVSLTAQEMIGELSAGYTNGLLKNILYNYSLTVPAAAAVDAALSGLVGKGCIRTGTGIRLSDEYEAFAKNFLIPESVVLFETFKRLPDEQLAVASTLCITAGVHDIVSFGYVGKQFDFKTLSASEMLLSIEDYMGCPDFPEDLPKQIPVQPVVQPVQHVQPVQQPTFPQQAAPAQSSGNTWKCACGTVNTGNFCSSCGSRRPS